MLPPRLSVGDTFERLTILGIVRTTRCGRNMWAAVCLCTCGNTKTICVEDMKPKRTTSCGCLKKEKIGRVNFIHGLSLSPEHRSYLYMHARCEEPSHIEYKRYGARGIRVCERWCGKAGFINFLADMGPRPSLQHSIDRINSDSNYEPTNCRWADRLMQARNKRNTIWVVVKGERLTTDQVQAKYGIAAATFRKRLLKGMPPEEAATKPVTKAA